MTTREVRSPLDLSQDATMKACRRAGIEERRIKGGCHHGWSIWRRSQVEELAEKRQELARLRAEGKKRCHACGEWKDRATEFWRGQSLCKPCGRVRNKETWAEQKRKRRKRPWSNLIEERIAEIVELSEGNGGRPGPRDALKYACLDVGYAHRPCLPGEKRERFCAKCTAERCYHHPKLTPAEVRKWKRTPTLYPERRVLGYVGGR